MDVFEAIWTTRAMRRLDTAREVPDADILLLLEAAGKAPSGGNSQPVRWVVVRDAQLRARIGELYCAQARPTLLATYSDRARSDPGVARMLASALHLADNLGAAPVILIACAPATHPRLEGSVFPAIQNLMLAARARRLGTTLTGMHRQDEGPLKSLLGIPDEVSTFALIPVGYPLGRWGEAKRRPVREVAYWDHWGDVRSDIPDVIERPPAG